MFYDVVIVGAGQAGLVMGYYLKKTNLSFLILDKNERVGDVWRKRYDSLVLFTPRAYSCLPGLDLDGKSNGFPTKDEIANYLERYALAFDLPIRFNSSVEKMYKENDVFYLQTNQTTIQAKQVVIATGPFQTPHIPTLSGSLSKSIIQLHSSDYQNPSQLQEGSVLIVGGGNSGAQLAVELSESHKTYLSVGHRFRFLPLTIQNKSIFVWFDILGILKANSNSVFGKIIRKQDDIIFGYNLKEKIHNGEIIVKGRTCNTKGNQIIFDDDTSVEVTNIIWATGYKSDYSWIDIPEAFEKNEVRHKRGNTNVEGLYFLGLPWQQRRGSALLQGVGEDAKYLLSVILSKHTKI